MPPRVGRMIDRLCIGPATSLRFSILYVTCEYFGCRINLRSSAKTSRGLNWGYLSGPAFNGVGDCQPYLLRQIESKFRFCVSPYVGVRRLLASCDESYKPICRIGTKSVRSE